tara:strand:+ start:1049 stop:2407 length:1359 start_codon:yes stop_codon:yes gene_type:complete
MKNNFPDFCNCTISIIGLGYVGLPLLIEFYKTKKDKRTDIPLNRKIVGFDINDKRINDLKNNIDNTKEVTQQELSSAKDIIFTSNINELIFSDVFIVTVPTPIDDAKNPNLSPLKKACKQIGNAIKKRLSNSYDKNKCNPVIIFESTVYPGATEENCIPIIEEFSELKLNEDFYVGYSPERINPGDKNHKLKDITKITSGSNQESSEWIDNLYLSIINAGTYKCESIKVAEAAKVIENTQRDLNIALINELSMIFKKLNIDTLDVLKAASTKWNFMSFNPGLVGGHCIGVDPYYLTYKAQQINYYPQVVLAGRRINDSMGGWIVDQLILEMAKNNLPIGNAYILIAGISFKENCPDVRNTKVIDLVSKLKNYNMKIFIHDPVADKEETMRIHKIELNKKIPKNVRFSAAIIAVSHNEFKNKEKYDWNNIVDKRGIIFDLKGILDKSENTIRP